MIIFNKRWENKAEIKHETKYYIEFDQTQKNLQDLSYLESSFIMIQIVFSNTETQIRLIIIAVFISKTIFL